MNRPIRTLVVDDSPFVCRLMAASLESGGDVRVVGTAESGPQAVELVRRLCPQVVTLDLEMPGMSGLEVLDQIMHGTPTPVVVVSGLSRRGAAATLRALELGAVDYVLKYNPDFDVDPQTLKAEILAKVRQASRVKVIRSLKRSPNADSTPSVERKPEPQSRRQPPALPRVPSPALSTGVVVLGASTGGPQALQAVLAGLPADFPAAVVVVQHVPELFTQALVTQLARHAALPVKEAQSGDVLRAGETFVTPGGRHLSVRAGGALEVYRGEKVGGYRPSIDVTMQSVARVYGSGACGVVLSGMGCDGAKGLEAIRARGGRTFAQDEASCVIASMPAEAVKCGAVETVAPPTAIAELLRLWGKARCEAR